MENTKFPACVPSHTTASSADAGRRKAGWHVCILELVVAILDADVTGYANEFATPQHGGQEYATLSNMQSDTRGSSNH